MPRYMVERTFPDGLNIPINADGAAACRRGRSLDRRRFDLDVDVLASAAAEVDDAGHDKQDAEGNDCHDDGDCGGAATTRINDYRSVCHGLLQSMLQ